MEFVRKSRCWFIILVISIADQTSTKQLDLIQCSEALGLRNGAIPDSALTASSSYSPEYGPQAARLNSGNAWCPKNLIDMTSTEFLQIDLGKPTLVTKLETAGRFNYGMGIEYTTHFRVEYQRDGHEWTRYGDKSGKEIFQGNNNTYSYVTNDLDPPIALNKIRIIPLGEILDTACLRVELYGCGITVTKQTDLCVMIGKCFKSQKRNEEPYE